MELTFFDVSVIILIGFCLITSLLKGMVKELFSLLAYGAGFFAAHYYNSMVAVYLETYVGGFTAGKVLGFFIIFIVVALIVKLLGSLTQKYIHSAGELSFLDRFLGAGLGVLKGAFIISIIMIPIGLFPNIYNQLTAGSIIAPYLNRVTSYLKKNILNSEMIKNKSEEIGFEKISKLKKQLSRMSVAPEEMNSPQDDHSDSSKKALNDLLNSIQRE